MDNNKELNLDELENVTGGADYAGYTSLEDLKFAYSIGTHIEIPSCFELFHQFTIGSTITKLGYVYMPDLGYYEPCYYLSACKSDESNWNGWYPECTLNAPNQQSWAHAKAKGNIVEI